MQVGVLSFWQTHLPLRERARQLLIQESKRQNDRPLSEILPKIDAALEVAANADRYQKRHLPGWTDMPQELKASVEASLPNPGGHPHLNTMFALKQQSQEMLQALKTPYTEPTDEAIEAVVKQYLELQGKPYNPSYGSKT